MAAHDLGDCPAAADLEPPMTPEEAEALAELFADELARGWIPTRHDLEAGLAAIRGRR